MNDERNSFTRQLLINAGIKKDIRILDIGCGIGEVSFLAYELINETGEIIGIDMNENAIDIANKSLNEKGIKNIKFITTSIEDIPKDIGEFDLIIGRRILMYLDNPLTTIKLLKSFLKLDGLMAFQESDAVGFGLTKNELPKHTKFQKWVWDTIEKENGNIHIGSQLYSIFTKANLNVVDIYSQAIIQTPETGSDLAWLVKMIAPRIIKNGIANEEELNLDNLESELEEEMNKAKTSFIRDMNFGIIAKNE